MAHPLLKVQGGTLPLNERVLRDLRVEQFMDDAFVDHETRELARSQFAAIPTQVDDIMQRQDVLRTLYEDEALCATVQNATDCLSSAKMFLSDSDKELSLGYLVNAVQNITTGTSTFANHNSPLPNQLDDVRTQIRQFMETDSYRRLADASEKLKGVQSVRIDVGLNANGSATHYRIVGVTDEKVPPPILGGLFGKTQVLCSGSQTNNSLEKGIDRLLNEGLRHQLTSALRGEASQIFNHVVPLNFVLQSVEYAKRLSGNRRLGVNVCFPRIHDDDSGTSFTQAFNAGLTREYFNRCIENIVPVNIQYSNSEDVLTVITGSHSGGKTTILRTAGFNAVLAQSGHYVFAQDAVFRPLDSIHTSFTDTIQGGYGSHASELDRLKAALKNGTPRGLVLLDEIGRGTEPEAGARRASRILNGLYDLNIPTFVVSHNRGIPNGLAQLEYVRLIHATPEHPYEFKSGIGDSHEEVVAKELGMSDEDISRIVTERRHQLYGNLLDASQ